MTDTTTATKSKTTKHAASSFNMPDYGVQKFEIPKFEREMAEKGVEHTRDAYAKGKVASDEAADLLKNTYEAAAKGATYYNLKIFEMARDNTNTAFDYAHQMLAVKSLSEFVSLSTEHARNQFEAMTAQTKELTALAQKMTTDITEPLKTGVTKAFNDSLACSR